MVRQWVVALVVLVVASCGGGSGGGSPTAAKLRFVQFEGTVNRVESESVFDLEVLFDSSTSISGPTSCEEGVCSLNTRTELVPAGQHTLDWKIVDHTGAAQYAVSGEILILFGDGGLDESIPVSEQERLAEGESIRKTFSF